MKTSLSMWTEIWWYTETVKRLYGIHLRGGWAVRKGTSQFIFALSMGDLKESNHSHVCKYKVKPNRKLFRMVSTKVRLKSLLWVFYLFRGDIRSIYVVEEKWRRKLSTPSPANGRRPLLVGKDTNGVFLCVIVHVYGTLCLSLLYFMYWATVPSFIYRMSL